MTFTGIMAGWVFSYTQCCVKVTSQFTNRKWNLPFVSVA